MVCPPAAVPTKLATTEEDKMADCTAQQQRLDELKGELRDLQGQQQGASPEQKGGIGRAILQVRQKIATAEANLQHCLALRGTLFPAYYVTTLLYAPPGIGSEVTYANGSTTGTTTQVTNAFKPGIGFSTSGGFLGNGLDVSVAFSGGSKNGTSFEVKKESSSILGLESQLDEVDHSRDTYLIWTNVKIDVTEQGDSGLVLDLGVKGDSDAMNIVSLTGAELRDPTLIPAHKQANLANFTQRDFDNIRALNPFTHNKTPDPNRFRHVKQLQLDGPDHPGDALQKEGTAVSDEHSAGVIRGLTTQLNVGLTLDSGFDFGAKTKLAVSATFEWDYESSTNITAGTKEEATVLLKTTTVGYHNVIDVYEDTVFKTFAFVSQTGPMLGKSAVVVGAVTNKSLQPVFNERVDVIDKNAIARTVFTNAQGIYRLFSIPAGDLRITVAGVTKTVTLQPCEKLELPFEISAEPSY
jgi:hypothetical protein